jgi:acyl-CoA synthetase (AMP-forming)/AMP-acid ligase II
LKRVHCGSAPLSKALWHDIRDWTGIKDVFNTYGITETGSWTAGTTIGDFEPEDGLIGYPWGASVKILPTALTEECWSAGPASAQGEEGYIWLNTPALMQSYLDREDLTRDVVWNGWFSTGDAGYLDERGCLYLKGRLREEINKGGMKVYPGDVDAAAENESGVLDVCAFPVDDPLYDQNVGIALVVDGDPDLTMPALRYRMAERLGRHQMPVRWYLLETIPRTARGKVNRDRIAERCKSLPSYSFPPAEG